MRHEITLNLRRSTKIEIKEFMWALILNGYSPYLEYEMDGKVCVVIDDSDTQELREN